MLRSVARTAQPKVEPSHVIGHANPVYVEGYGFVPPSQVSLTFAQGWLLL